MALPLLAEIDEEPTLRREARRKFERMSSGHAIVLLTMTRLVDTVDEKTLVLMDEPESHLHPPLLSAFTRALSDLLTDRNGVAIIATHSPVVAQEVPRSCVWLMERSRAVGATSRPQLETFGENVGVLTREIFGLEVSRSGFHDMLRQAVDQGQTYDEIVSDYKGRLGFEAQALLRALIASQSFSPDAKEDL
jgi:ABC-type cobalamin/Fe3+-siderophores transport system ATPase subunit